MARIYLGVDIGTTSAKCMAVREDGKTMAVSRYPYAMSLAHQGWAEQDPEDYWRALVHTVREVVKECQAGEIVSLALSTQGDTLIVTDANGKPLMPAISWMDARAQAEFEELLSEADASFWYRETGSPLNALSSACKIRWISRNRPDIARFGARFCYVADYLANRLCGRFAADVPSASWMPLFSPSRRDWSQPVLDILEIGRETLPEVLESGELIGELLPEAACELGLTPETKLIAGAFDQAAAAHGAGARAGHTSVLSCGTAWVLYSVAANAVADGDARLCTCCHTGRNEIGLVLPFSGGSTYEWLGKMIGEVVEGDPGSGADPLIFVPHLYGGLSPDWRAGSKGTVVGLTLAHTRADIQSALMRGLCSEARRNLEAAEALCGRVESIRMVGGAATGRNWPKLAANVLNRTIEVPEETESACFGAAMIASGGLSEPWNAFRPVIKVDPAADEVSVEQHLYEKYLRVYEAMSDLHQ